MRKVQELLGFISGFVYLLSVSADHKKHNGLYGFPHFCDFLGSPDGPVRAETAPDSVSWPDN